MALKGLAHKTGMSHMSLWYIESGNRAQPRVASILKIAHALDVPVCVLLGEPCTHQRNNQCPFAVADLCKTMAAAVQAPRRDT